jgi:hypothetical protein
VLNQRAAGDNDVCGDCPSAALRFNNAKLQYTIFFFVSSMKEILWRLEILSFGRKPAVCRLAAKVNLIRALFFFKSSSLN